MEPGILAAAVLLVLIIGAVAMAVRDRFDGWGLPGFRTTSGTSIDLVNNDLALGMRAEALPEGGLDGSRSASALGALLRERDVEPLAPEPLLVEIPTAPLSPLAERLQGMEAQLHDLREELSRQSVALASLGSELQRARETEDARREVALERLRGDVMHAVSRVAGERHTAAPDRRADVSGELYARLARFESALAAVTNPILLPGEPYAPPAEFLAETLIWENWNEVGERAYALADCYSAQRLHLSEAARSEVGTFVTAMRVLLTRSIYPNLDDEPDSAQRAALREALESIATELPVVRAVLDREYSGASAA